MTKKDINVHIGLKGTDQLVRDSGKAGDALNETGKKAKQAGDKGASSMGNFAKKSKKASDETNQTAVSVARMADKLLALAGGAAIINEITRAIQLQTKAAEENAAALEKQQNALVRLQFLGDYYKEKPQLRQEIIAMAEFGRRPFEDVANAAYNLRSKNAAMTEERRMGILREALEMGRTDPSLPLDTLVDMFSLYGKQSGVTDANQIQNVLQQTITEAGGSGADVAAYMPRFLPVGMAGGLTPAQTAGLWAYGTTQEAEASVATTGLRAIMMGLQGKGSPEGAELLDQFGIKKEMDFFTKIDLLGHQNIDLATAEILFQREGASMGLNLLKDPSALMRTIESVTSADRSDIDLTNQKLKELFASDTVAATEENKRLLEVAIQNLRSGDVESLDFETRQKMREYIQRKKGASEWGIWMAGKLEDTMRALGKDINPLNDPNLIKELMNDELLPGNTTIINNHYDMSRHTSTKDPGSPPRTGDL